MPRRVLRKGVSTTRSGKRAPYKTILGQNLKPRQKRKKGGK